jgi:hypothetical protein
LSYSLFSTPISLPGEKFLLLLPWVLGTAGLYSLNIFFHNHFDPEDGGIKFLRSVGNTPMPYGANLKTRSPLMVINLRVPEKYGNLLSSWANVSLQGLFSFE